MVSCPICKTEMRAEFQNGTEVDVCPDHGIWLDQSELLTITEEERHNSPDFFLADWFRTPQRPTEFEGREVPCPRCGKTMQVDIYERVHLDWCKDHGVFLDSGELDAILSNLRLDPLYVRKVALRIGVSKY